MFRKTLAMLAATSLIGSPALAQSEAASLSVARAGAPAEGANDLRGNVWFPPLLFATIVILGILTATGVIFDDDEEPESP